MDKIRLNLHQDLEVKFDRLRWMSEQPGIFIDESFASLRKEIDLDTERLIHKLGNDNSNETKLQTINSTRSCFIRFLDKMQQKLFENLSKITDKYNASWAEFEKQVEEFSASKEFLNVSQLEDAYLQLALEIIDATNELERRLLDDQTFAFVPAHKTDQMGTLVYLGMDCLNQDEMSCLKIQIWNSGAEFKTLQSAFHESLNSSLAVGISRPFVFTRKVILISRILDYFNTLERSPGKIVYHEGSSKSKLDLSSEDDPFYHGFSMGNSQRLSRYMPHVRSFEHFQLKEIPCGYMDQETFTLSLCSDGRTRFEMADSFIQLLTSLHLSGYFEALDVEQLTKAVKMQYLTLTGACLLNHRFPLDFLSSFVELRMLKMTLPDAKSSIDFKVFENLKNLHEIHLESAASLDWSIKRPQLTKENLDSLSTLPRLKSVHLSYFEIESLERDMFSKLSGLDYLHMTNNDIVRIENCAFGNCFGNKTNGSADGPLYPATKLPDLSNNRIEQLLPGVFDDLVDITNMFLMHNSIRHIAHGVFNKLVRLDGLLLSQNPIESIEANAFEGCSQLTMLHLKNCKLKSIDNAMFKGLSNLRYLYLDNNQIERLEVVSEKSEMSKISEIVSLVTIELTNRRLFVNVPNISVLDLQGNKLKQLNLNWFCNLKFLKQLNVSNNQISQLNEEIRSGVLCKLEELDLSNNQLTCVGRRSFSNARRLLTLNLSKNKLERLDDDFFNAFKDLMSIELQENNLTFQITIKTFAECVQLYSIDLLDNPSVSVREDALSLLKQLRYFNFETRTADPKSSRRFLENISNPCFTSKMWGLRLVNSSIENLDAFKIGHRFSELTRLDLSKNLIRNIHRESLSGLTLLKMLNLSGNMIETLDDPTVFQDMSKLEELNLSGNKLKSIHRQVFRCLNDLKTLDLSNNTNLINIDAGMFRGLINLKRLNLACNNIAFFDLSLLFRSCWVLERLDLSNNQLDDESVNETSMNESTSQDLKELMLAQNRLKRLDFVRHLYRLEKLDLSGNKIDSVISNGSNRFSRLVNLKHVNLSDNRVEKSDLDLLLSHFKQLRLLDISNILY